MCQVGKTTWYTDSQFLFGYIRKKPVYSNINVKMTDDDMMISCLKCLEKIRIGSTDMLLLFKESD